MSKACWHEATTKVHPPRPLLHPELALNMQACGRVWQTAGLSSCVSPYHPEEWAEYGQPARPAVSGLVSASERRLCTANAVPTTTADCFQHSHFFKSRLPRLISSSKRLFCAAVCIYFAKDVYLSECTHHCTHMHGHTHHCTHAHTCTDGVHGQS